MLALMDVGQPASYKVLTKGSPVYSSDGSRIGEVGHVLASEDLDVFDGIVIAEPLGAGGPRFADADDIDQIGERGVVLALDIKACQALPEPSANPAVMRGDPAETAAEGLVDKLRRAWDLISGKY